MATVLKSLGYATGQFGKNHQGDRDGICRRCTGSMSSLAIVYISTPRRSLKRGTGRESEFRRKFGPRGVLRRPLTARVEQTIVDTAAHKKTNGTIDDETLAAAKDFITSQVKSGKPFFVWWNGTRMHFRTHVRPEHRSPGNDEYTDGMIEHDGHVGELLNLLDDLGVTTIRLSSIRQTTVRISLVPDAGNTPFARKKLELGGRLSCSGLRALAGSFPRARC